MSLNIYVHVIIIIVYVQLSVVVVISLHNGWRLKGFGDNISCTNYYGIMNRNVFLNL